MMQLLAWTLLQSVLAVGGMALLTQALHGVPPELRAIAGAFLSWWAISGITALAASFGVLSFILSFTQWTTFVPLSTACSFACTIGISLMTGSETMSMRTIVGMALIVAGVAVIVSQRSVLETTP